MLTVHGSAIKPQSYCTLVVEATALLRLMVYAITLLGDQIHTWPELLDVSVAGLCRVHPNVLVERRRTGLVPRVNVERCTLVSASCQFREGVEQQGTSDAASTPRRTNAEIVDHSAFLVSVRRCVANAESGNRVVFNCVCEEPEGRVEVIFLHQVAPFLEVRLERLMDNAVVIGEHLAMDGNQLDVIFAGHNIPN